MEHNFINPWWSTSTFKSTPPNLKRKMDLAKPLPLLPSQRVNIGRDSQRTIKFSQSPSSDYQCRLSDNSNPGMMEDYGSSSSEKSFQSEKHTSSETGIEIWDSYWSPTNDFTFSSQLLQRPPIFRSEGSNLSQNNRNFASSNLVGLKATSTPSPSKPYRSRAVQPTRHVSQSKHNRPHTYSPFPLVPSKPSQTYNHNSWPLPDDSPTKRQRSHTSPTQYNTPSSTWPSSDFSICTTLEGLSSPSSSNGSSPLYISCNSRTPLFAPSVPSIPLNFLNNSNTVIEEEKSHFDFDDDDDEESKSAAAKLKKMLQIRTVSSEQDDGVGEKDDVVRSEKGSLRRLRKSLSSAASDANETLKGVFVFRGRK